MSGDTEVRQRADGDAAESRTPLHLGLAEQGKIHAVAGEHRTALLYYRHAMRLAVEAVAPEAFFRHYLECAIESLELMDCHAEVIDYCERVDAHYASIVALDEAQASFVARDRAAVAQRRALVLLKGGRRDEARRWLDEARRRAVAAALDLPLLERVGGWLDQGLHVAPERVVAAQHQLCYFSVTAGSTDPDRAVRLPPELLEQGMPR